MELFGKSSVRTSGLFLINELRMSEYFFSDTMKTGSGNCLDMTPSSFKSSRPTMISLLIAGVITALVLTEQLDVLRLIGAVPDVGTGSPLTLIYFLCEGLVGLMFLRQARSAAIRVAVLPVSGNVQKLNNPFCRGTIITQNVLATLSTSVTLMTIGIPTPSGIDAEFLSRVIFFYFSM